MILLIFRIVHGYLYVRADSKNPEKLLNLCAANGIVLWGVSIRGERLYFKIKCDDFKRFRKLRRAVRCTVHITHKVGLPFFLAAHKQRYGFVVGLLLFGGLLYYLSGFAWNICITGNKTIPSAQIVQSLKEIGIYEGVRLSGISVKDKRNELLIREHGLAWASINQEGCKLTVNVEEAQINTPQSDDPSNFKALCDGVITKVELISGTAEVQVGDAVEQGQLLASGIIEYSDQTTRFVRARGEIYARTVREYRLSQPLEVTELQKNGCVKRRTVLQFFGLNLPLFTGTVTGTFESSAPNISISSGQNYLPIRFICREFYETESVTYTLSEEQAKKRLTKQLDQQLQSDLLKGEVTDKNLRFFVENGALQLHAVVKCDENIAFEEKIIKDTGN